MSIQKHRHISTKLRGKSEFEIRCDNHLTGILTITTTRPLFLPIKF